MSEKVIPVTGRGGGQIIIPGKPATIGSVNQLSVQLDQTKSILQDQIEQLTKDFVLKNDLLRSQIEDIEKRFGAKQRDMIGVIHKLEKLVLEFLP